MFPNNKWHILYLNSLHSSLPECYNRHSYILLYMKLISVATQINLYFLLKEQNCEFAQVKKKSPRGPILAWVPHKIEAKVHVLTAAQSQGSKSERSKDVKQGRMENKYKGVFSRLSTVAKQAQLIAQFHKAPSQQARELLRLRTAHGGVSQR